LPSNYHCNIQLQWKTLILLMKLSLAVWISAGLSWQEEHLTSTWESLTIFGYRCWSTHLIMYTVDENQIYVFLWLITNLISTRFFFESERGLFPNTEFVFDLELPADFVPSNSDGEVETFELLPAKVCQLLFVIVVNIAEAWSSLFKIKNYYFIILYFITPPCSSIQGPHICVLCYVS
jgi:hypothetical protein